LAEKIESNPKLRRTRAVQRLTPAPATAYASTDGLENVAKQILGPHFLAEDAPVTKVIHVATIKIKKLIDISMPYEQQFGNMLS